VAVAVLRTPHLVLDEDYRIVEVGPAAEGAFGPLLGQDLGECFPDSEALFRPHYERARRTGAPVEFVQFYRGAVARIRAVPAGCRLEVVWERIVRLDTLTLDRFAVSLSEAIRRLNHREAELDRRVARGTLRALAGGRR
jgi:hypothetical protein